jgi:hypothetical protein
MLDGVMMQEIFHFKEHGYTPGEIIEHYQRTGRKPPSMPTVMKYYNMEAPPENPGAKLAKKKAFDREPYRSAIIRALTNNPGCCVSSVYDVLVESFGEGGKPGGLPGNQQTLRNYVRHLAATGAIPSAEEGGRVYDHVFDLPPGQQMLVDFGVVKAPQGAPIHFICLLLRYSRLLMVYAQDHKHNAEEACAAIYRAFQKIGGRPGELVIDQDSVFVVSEERGEVAYTRVFGDFSPSRGCGCTCATRRTRRARGPWRTR